MPFNGRGDGDHHEGSQDTAPPNSNTSNETPTPATSKLPASSSTNTRFSPTPSTNFSIPKNRSSGSLRAETLPSQTPVVLDKPRGASLDPTSLSPIITSDIRLHGPGAELPAQVTGLQRIRQQPSQSRGPSMNNNYTNLNTMSIAMPPPQHGLRSGPTSPILTTSTDLARFPSESLHSFSFSQKSDDLLHARHNVLKKTIELLGGKLGWQADGLAVANAQAKVTGDAEVQGVVKLLSKVRTLEGKRNGGGLNLAGLGLDLGPATEPAEVDVNVFEKSFTTESPSSIEAPGALEGRGPRNLDGTEAGQRDLPSLSVDAALETDKGYQERVPFGMTASNPRSLLKRTFTDVGPLHLQSKLTEALAQPYIDDSSLLSPTTGPTINAFSAVGFNQSFHPHAHGRAGPQSQAIFTTELDSPWTIIAANDLACLIFRIQKAELRKIGILDLIREDMRKWMNNKLGRGRGNENNHSTKTNFFDDTLSLTQTKSLPNESSSKPSGLPSRSPITGGSITARLLSQPSSRVTGQGQPHRSQSADAKNATASRTKNFGKPPSHPPGRSRGVILCGDVVPILKRDGKVGSATVWVQEKKSGLIWVMEEIVEDISYVSVDEVGCVTKVTGHVEAIWGMERVRRGMDVTRILPGIPRLKGTNTGALDYEDIADLRRFTARTSNDISVPVTVDQLSGQPTFRISSFPNIAGMLVLSSTNLQVTSSNSVVCEALFGRDADGQSIKSLIPDFDKMLDLLMEEEHVDLVEGLVIPEQSFRKARAGLAIREGKRDVADVFLRPSGVPAVHRDGAEIMIDVQMRIVKSSSLAPGFNDSVINEESVDMTSSSIVYALWVTYSRMLHAKNHGIGPVSPFVSRPGTPPRQPSPTLLPDSDSEDSRSDSHSTKPSDSSTSSTESKPPSSPPSKPSASRRRSISDFIILEDMGSGAYGQVKLARPKSDPSTKVVLKYVVKSRILVDTWTRDRRLGTVPLEIHVLDYLRRLPDPSDLSGEKTLHHPNIVEMSSFFEDDVNYYIEMIPHGLPGMDLFDYIELRAPFVEEEARQIFAQVASAIEFLHVRARVVHRDIKDENVILDGEGRIKLIDFGSASYIRKGPFDVFVGTIDYAAPEVLTGVSYSGPPQDIWALGILLYTILYKENPFYNVDEIIDHDLRVPYVVSERSIELVRLMLDREVDRRVDIMGVVGHEWCREVVAEVNKFVEGRVVEEL